MDYKMKAKSFVSPADLEEFADQVLGNDGYDTADAGKALGINAEGGIEPIDVASSGVIKGEGAPTAATEGEVGDLYFDTTGCVLYQCNAVSTVGDVTTYTWARVDTDTQLQADWNQADSAAVDYIKNKPTIPAEVTVDASMIANSTNPVQSKVIQTALLDKPNIQVWNNAPTTASAGVVGDFWLDTTTNKLYQLKAVTPGTDPDPDTYTWAEVGGGSGSGLVRYGVDKTGCTKTEETEEWMKRITITATLPIGDAWYNGLSGKGSITWMEEGNERTEERSMSISVSNGVATGTVTLNLYKVWDEQQQEEVFPDYDWDGELSCVMIGSEDETGAVHVLSEDEYYALSRNYREALLKLNVNIKSGGYTFVSTGLTGLTATETVATKRVYLGARVDVACETYISTINYVNKDDVEAYIQASVACYDISGSSTRSCTKMTVPTLNQRTLQCSYHADPGQLIGNVELMSAPAIQLYIRPGEGTIIDYFHNMVIWQTINVQAEDIESISYSNGNLVVTLARDLADILNDDGVYAQVDDASTIGDMKYDIILSMPPVSVKGKDNGADPVNLFNSAVVKSVVNAYSTDADRPYSAVFVDKLVAASSSNVFSSDATIADFLTALNRVPLYGRVMAMFTTVQSGGVTEGFVIVGKRTSLVNNMVQGLMLHFTASGVTVYTQMYGTSGGNILYFDKFVNNAQDPSNTMMLNGVTFPYMYFML